MKICENFEAVPFLVSELNFMKNRFQRRELFLITGKKGTKKSKQKHLKRNVKEIKLQIRNVNQSLFTLTTHNSSRRLSVLN